MTYLMCDLKRRVLPVTLILISFLLSSELVCARPQEVSLPAVDKSNVTKEAEKVEPVSNATLNDRYNTHRKTEKQNMFNYLDYFDSNCLSVYSKRDSNQATNSTEKFFYLNRKIHKNNKKIRFYFKKIKTKIKQNEFQNLTKILLKNELWVPYKQIKSNRDLIFNHFKLLLIIISLKLFTLLRSIKSQCPIKIKDDYKYKNQKKFDYYPTKCQYNSDLNDISFYIEQIIDTSFDSLYTLENINCKPIIDNLYNFYENHVKKFDKKRVKRSIKNQQNKNKNYASELSHTIRNQLTVNEKTDYLDNLYQEKLIHNFLRNSLPDLNSDYAQYFMPEPAEEGNIIEKTVPNIKSPYLMVESSNYISIPKPLPHFSNTVEITTSSPNSNTQSNDLYPVYLLTTKPKPYKPTTYISSVHSQTVTESNTLLTTNSYMTSTIDWLPNHQRPISIQSNMYSQITTESNPYKPPKDWNNFYPINQDKDNVLQFPYPESNNNSPADEPFFVEPIVVSSVDQLPTNYPIPMENSSLGHSPVTVLVGGKPPEIVLLEDVTFQSVSTIYQDSQESLNQAPGVAEDPSMAAAAPAVAAAPPAAAPFAPAGAGALAGGGAGLGTLLSAGVGPAAVLLGGLASAAGGAASAIGAVGGVGLGQNRPQEGTPNQGGGGGGGEEGEGENDMPSYDLEYEHEEWYHELAESVMYMFSFRFLRQAMTALYSLVMPHVSFMLTSGFTMMAFLFPWLYPHIVVPLVSLMSGFSARFITGENVQPTIVEQSIKIYHAEPAVIITPDKSKNEQKLYGDITVDSGLDFGRAALESSTKISPTINTLKPIIKQSQPTTATDMMISDVRTPPKIKSQIVHSQMQSLLTPGKGEAIPVVLEGNDEAALEKISSDNFKYTHSDATPSSGLSTWILLNSDTVSTPYSHHKKVPKPPVFDPVNITADNNTDSRKKPAKQTSTTTTTTTTTTEKMVKSKIETVVMKKPERKPIATIQKVNQTHAKKPTTQKLEPEEIPTTTSVSLQDMKFKNKTPVVVGKVPSTNLKEVINSTTPMNFVELPIDNGTRLGTPVVTFPHVPVKQKNITSSTKKPALSTKPAMVLISSGTPTKLSSPEVSIASTVSMVGHDNISSVSTEEIQTDTTTETTTKKSTSSKKKKKKNKNKNKRRRTSTKKPSKIQSKISDDDNSTSKLPTGVATTSARPLSTRIYNYLAREVMPNVGVGIVGLMLTAGLAGLLLYPFGGAVPIRRNYEKPGPSYNLNDYPPIGEVDNAQPEESVLSQVLAGMSNSMNQYSREQPDVLYKTHPKYKPARFDNPNTYNNHHKEIKYTTPETVAEENKYSELGDVVSGPHESVKFTSFDINDSIKYPLENSQPSPSYSSIDFTTSGQKEYIYHQYSPPSDPVKHDSPVYSTLGEYASYSNPSEPMQNPVYNGETYDYKNHKNENSVQEFKVGSDLEVATQSNENQTTTTAKPKHEHQPSFAALEGIPKNYRTLQTSIRFEDTASVLPMNQDFVPSDGVFATSVEHGPRNMKLLRKKRNTSSENELDSVLIDTTEKPNENSSPVQFITTESVEKITTAFSENTEEEKITTRIYDKVEIITKPTDYVKNFNNAETNDLSDSKNYSSPSTVSPMNPISSHPDNFHFSIPSTSPKVEVIPNANSQCENCDLSNIEEHPPASTSFTIGTFFRKILDFKFRIGLELIRATSDVISKYLSTVQQRMTEALREIQRSAFRMNDKKSRNDVIKKREKRHIIYGS